MWPILGTFFIQEYHWTSPFVLGKVLNGRQFVPSQEVGCQYLGSPALWPSTRSGHPRSQFPQRCASWLGRPRYSGCFSGPCESKQGCRYILLEGCRGLANIFGLEWLLFLIPSSSRLMSWLITGSRGGKHQYRFDSVKQKGGKETASNASGGEHFRQARQSQSSSKILPNPTDYRFQK